MIIDGWNCVELYAGTDYTTRTATSRWVEVDADASGIEIREHSAGGWGGASGSTAIPANVLMWLMQAVR